MLVSSAYNQILCSLVVYIDCIQTLGYVQDCVTLGGCMRSASIGVSYVIVVVVVVVVITIKDIKMLLRITLQ